MEEYLLSVQRFYMFITYLLPGQKIKLYISNFICNFINALLFNLTQVDESITSTLNICENI